jgi:hypothetical protein
MKKIFAALLLIVIVISACNKDSQNQNVQNYTIPVSPSLKDFGYFLPGTYWIYQDSVTHSLDSEYVVSASQGNTAVLQSQNMGYTGTFGWYKEQWMGTHEGQVNNLSVDMTQVMHSPGIVWIDKHIGTSFKGQNVYMSDNWAPGYTIFPNSEPNGYLEFIGVYDSVKVLSTSYKTVIQYYDRQNSLYQYNRTNIYISKNKGIIRKELLDSNRVWNLVRSHIVQ